MSFMIRISERDREILRLLEENARLSYTELARKLGVTEGAVRKRIKKLEREGIIRGYTVILNPKKLGYGVVALVGLDVEPESYVRVREELRGDERVRKVLVTTGDHMIILEAWFKDSWEMEGFVRELEGKEGVHRVCPSIVVEEIK